MWGTVISGRESRFVLTVPQAFSQMIKTEVKKILRKETPHFGCRGPIMGEDVPTRKNGGFSEGRKKDKEVMS